MFSGVHGESWVIRLRPADREALVAAGGHEFAPMGRVMKEYATFPQRLVEDARQVHRWLAKSFAYAGSLPPKAPRKRSNKARRSPATDA